MRGALARRSTRSGKPDHIKVGIPWKNADQSVSGIFLGKRANRSSVSPDSPRECQHLHICIKKKREPRCITLPLCGLTSSDSRESPKRILNRQIPIGWLPQKGFVSMKRSSPTFQPAPTFRRGAVLALLLSCLALLACGGFLFLAFNAALDATIPSLHLLILPALILSFLLSLMGLIFAIRGLIVFSRPSPFRRARERIFLDTSCFLAILVLLPTSFFLLFFLAFSLGGAPTPAP